MLSPQCFLGHFLHFHLAQVASQSVSGGPPGSQACGSRLTVPSPWRVDGRINSLSERSATRSANPVCIFRVCSISYLTCRVAPPLSGEVPARYQQGMFFSGFCELPPPPSHLSRGQSPVSSGTASLSFRIERLSTPFGRCGVNIEAQSGCRSGSGCAV